MHVTQRHSAAIPLCPSVSSVVTNVLKHAGSSRFMQILSKLTFQQPTAPLPLCEPHDARFGGFSRIDLSPYEDIQFVAVVGLYILRSWQCCNRGWKFGASAAPSRFA